MSRKTIQVSDDVKVEIQKIRETMGLKNESQVIKALIGLMDRHFNEYLWFVQKVSFEESNPNVSYESYIGRDIDGNKFKTI